MYSEFSLFWSRSPTKANEFKYKALQSVNDVDFLNIPSLTQSAAWLFPTIK